MHKCFCEKEMCVEGFLFEFFGGKRSLEPGLVTVLVQGWNRFFLLSSYNSKLVICSHLSSMMCVEKCILCKCVETFLIQNTYQIFFDIYTPIPQNVNFISNPCNKYKFLRIMHLKTIKNLWDDCQKNK